MSVSCRYTKCLTFRAKPFIRENCFCLTFLSVTKGHRSKRWTSLLVYREYTNLLQFDIDNSAFHFRKAWDCSIVAQSFWKPPYVNCDCNENSHKLAETKYNRNILGISAAGLPRRCSCRSSATYNYGLRAGGPIWHTSELRLLIVPVSPIYKSKQNNTNLATKL